MGSYLVQVYIVYAIVGVSLTVWLARVLSKNGAIFLRDVFVENPDLASAVNHLLVVGFYLFNLGYAALILKASPAIGIVAAIEVLAWKLGLLMLSLALMHFVNMFIFHRIRRRAGQPQNAPPVPPQGYYPAMANGAGQGYAAQGGYGPEAYGQHAQNMQAASGHSAFELIERQDSRGADEADGADGSDEPPAQRKRARRSAVKSA